MSEHLEVDFDLLADYVGDALAGTPDEERVAALVATDPGWAREHELLVAALAATAGDLAAFTERTAEPMPDEVVERLLAVLPPPAVAASPPTQAVPSSPPTQAVPSSPPTQAVPSSLPKQAVGAGSGPARDHRAPGGPRAERARRPLRSRRRPRWLAWAAPAVAAAAVVALAGVWISQSVGTGTTATDTAAGAGTAAEAPAASNAMAVPRYNSGRDYSGAGVAAGFRDTDGSRTQRSPAALHSEGPMSDPGGDSTQEGAAGFTSKAVPELLRLGTGAALAVCVAAIEQAHGQGPITVTAADFAAYQGRPAVIVFFTDATGARWGWAVGPDCGPAGTDELFRSRVG